MYNIYIYIEFHVFGKKPNVHYTHAIFIVYIVPIYKRNSQDIDYYVVLSYCLYKYNKLNVN